VKNPLDADDKGEIRTGPSSSEVCFLSFMHYSVLIYVVLFGFRNLGFVSLCLFSITVSMDFGVYCRKWVSI